MAEGLKLTVEEGRCVQASAYVPADNFTQYRVRDDVDVMFRISLATLAECLNIFGSGEECCLNMYYRCEGSPLLLVLQPQGTRDVMTDCELATGAAEEALELRDPEGGGGEGADGGEGARLVLRAPALLALLADLERGADVLELRVAPAHPHLCIITSGTQDQSCIEVPKSSEMVQSFACARALAWRYQLHHVRLITKALALATKVVLRCGGRGLLGLQLKLEREEQRQMFAEFTMLPLVDD